MQVKCEVFSRFGNSVDFSSGEPLGGVEASTVGADLCVRPSSPERSLFCGRTRRSAPTQATSARQFHSSNAVTSICRDARLGRRPSVRPLYQSETLYQRVMVSILVTMYYNGRSDRASLQESSRLVRPYTGLLVLSSDICARSKGHNKRKTRLMRSCGPLRRAFLFVAYIC